MGSHNANQIPRPPAWRKTDPDGALWARAEDLAAIGAPPGDWVAVISKTGRIVVPVRRGEHAAGRDAAPQAIAKIARCDLIAVDDIGMLPAGQRGGPAPVPGAATRLGAGPRPDHRQTLTARAVRLSPMPSRQSMRRP